MLAVLVAALAYLDWRLMGMEVDISPIVPSSTDGGGHSNVGPSISTRLDKKPLAQFPETLARPLFNPTRRLPPPAERKEAQAQPVKAPTPSADGLRLIGLVKTEAGHARALIRSADEPLGTWVEPGDEIAGWRLTTIGDGKVTVESGGRRFELNLYTPGEDVPETKR